MVRRESVIAGAVQWRPDTMAQADGGGEHMCAHMERGAWSVERSAWRMAHGAWSMEHGAAWSSMEQYGAQHV
jgi:hypothetical protein